MDRSRIEPLVVGSGSEFVVWDDSSTASFLAGGREPDLVLVDLTLSGALEAVEQFTARGVRVIAFGPHVDRSGLLRVRQAGADEVLARSIFFAKLGDLLG
jgi:CheY-like chemotaxis protein